MERNYAPAHTVPEEFNGAHTAHGASDAADQSPTHLLPSQVDELLTALRRKDEFLATLCHELRSPLGAIENALGILNGHAGQELAVQQRISARRKASTISSPVAGPRSIMAGGPRPRDQCCKVRRPPGCLDGESSAPPHRAT